LVLIKCENCWTLKRKHHVCPSCGYYRWKQILTIKTKKSENIIEA
jgi:ribosomal protein L32